MRTKDKQDFLDMVTARIDDPRPQILVLVSVAPDMPADTCTEQLDAETHAANLEILTNTSNAEATIMALRDAGQRMLTRELEHAKWSNGSANRIRRILGVEDLS